MAMVMALSPAGGRHDDGNVDGIVAGWMEA